ncbi:MAG: hypothetical protein WCL44_14560, partial [bacterium]
PLYYRVTLVAGTDWEVQGDVTYNGTLINYTNGNSLTPARVYVDQNYHFNAYGDYYGQPYEANANTDANAVFAGIVNLRGDTSPKDGGTPFQTLTFTGLSTNRSYEFIGHGNKNKSPLGSYAFMTLQGYCTNVTPTPVYSIAPSVSGTTAPSYDPASLTITYDTGWNPASAGYVAGWNNIVPADNGTFTIRVTGSGNALGAFMLAERLHPPDPMPPPYGTTLIIR